MVASLPASNPLQVGVRYKQAQLEVTSQLSPLLMTLYISQLLCV